MKTLAGLLPEKYTLSTDPEVTFTLKPLTAAERLDILSTANDAKRFGQAMQQACEYTITGWSGFKDEAGAPVAFSVGEIRRLPTEVLIEVAQRALKLSTADEEAKKTSGSQSPS
jgi:hypothetical protein